MTAGAHLAELPADLVLVLLHAHVGVHALAADQLEVRVPAIRQPLLHGVEDGKVLSRVAVVRRVLRPLDVAGLLEARLAAEHNAALPNLQPHSAL